ncbi:hypothetical protein STCU_11032 [Strigomonas culicis]|uniref:Uncharacterized protein n=1 Tax=Strigomonas culicis TaxID=28005 RepID=S9TK49_9TRYP|nr:hypothetical protein STCU_11032 [Strigomonas culicis]|eukprot:EPY16723.1 hypothetical protein STCU_11032 [Strigomonas culicis]
MVPNTNLHQETLALLRDSVLTFLAAAREVVGSTNKAFGGWWSREEQWTYNWQLMLQRIVGSPAWGDLLLPLTPPQLKRNDEVTLCWARVT